MMTQPLTLGIDFLFAGHEIDPDLGQNVILGRNPDGGRVGQQRGKDSVIKVRFEFSRQMARIATSKTMRHNGYMIGRVFLHDLGPNKLGMLERVLGAFDLYTISKNGYSLTVSS